MTFSDDQKLSLYEIAKLGRKLMSEHGLYNWRFDFNNRKNSYGVCNHGRRTIFLSKLLAPQMRFKDLENTILHEIAHALVGIHHGHNHVWRRKALEIGCNGHRTANYNVKVDYKYLATCPACGKKVGVNRRPTRKYAHNCGGSRTFDPSRELHFVQQY